MRMQRIVILGLFALVFAGCSGTDWGKFTQNSAEIAKVNDGEGRQTVYELKRSDNDDNCSLIIRTQREYSRPHLGMTVSEIDKNLAQRKMLTPYSGMFTSNVVDGGAADKAGVLPGDIIKKMNGTDVIYTDQFTHMVSNITPGEEILLTVLRGYENKTELEIKLKPDLKKVVTPSTKSIPLDSLSKSGFAYVGIKIVTMPAEWTIKIFDDDRSTVMISGVELGSPGYKAGLRTGDRVVSVNGEYFKTADDLHDWIRDRGPQGDSVIFEVYRNQTGTYKTEFDLDDYRREYDIYLPFIFELDHSPYRTEWDFGPLGLLAGYNGKYSRAYDRRDPNYNKSISFILGLFKRSWGPKYSRTRLLWFFTYYSNAK